MHGEHEGQPATWAGRRMRSSNAASISCNSTALVHAIKQAQLRLSAQRGCGLAPAHARCRGERPASGLPPVDPSAAADLAPHSLPALQVCLWRAGRLDGSGRRADALGAATLPDGATFCGAYAADLRAGPGVSLFPAGGGYVGGFAGSRRSGPGALQRPRMYRGLGLGSRAQHLDACKGLYQKTLHATANAHVTGALQQLAHGPARAGVLLLPDGGLYQGAFVADRFEGRGIMYARGQGCHVGEWQAGRKHGQVHGNQLECTGVTACTDVVH